MRRSKLVVVIVDELGRVEGLVVSVIEGVPKFCDPCMSVLFETGPAAVTN